MSSLAVRQQVNRVLVTTLVFNLLVAFGKIAIGLTTGALAITADGFHSLTDGTSNVVALVASTIAGAPPDDDHPYGHQRFETLAALGIGLLLFLTAWETTRGVLDRLSGGDAPELTPLAFAMMASTLVINIGVNRYQVGQGRRLKSQLLLTDAAHTGADIYVTASVLVSMTLMVLFGWYWIDSVTALAVVVLIARTAWGIVRQTGTVLVDTAPFSPEQITAIVMQTPAVYGVVRARSRGAEDAIIIDLDVEIAPEVTAERAASLKTAIETGLRSRLPGISEVNTQFVPVATDSRDYRTLVPVLAESLGLSAHHVYRNTTPQGEVLELHVEVPPGQTLEQSHTLASQLEEALRQRLPMVNEIVTHIEPGAVEVATRPSADSQAVGAAVMTLLIANYPTIDWHDLTVYDQPRGVGISLHARMTPEISIEEAHDLAAAAERLLRAQIAGLDRITIHTEPA